MASIVSAFNDAFSEKRSFLKIALYAIPVFLCARLFLSGQMNSFYLYGTITAVLLFILMTIGINNVRENNQEILTLHPLKLLLAFIKTAIVVIPQAIFWLGIAYAITKVIVIPEEIPHANLIFNIVVWSITGTMVFTAYLSFAKYMEIRDGYNYQIIFLSCVDVFAALLFYALQIVLAAAVIVGPFAYVYYYLIHVPFDHWSFVLLCSLAGVACVSISANYFAQVSYEYIVLSNDRKDDYQITKLVDDMDTSKN